MQKRCRSRSESCSTSPGGDRLHQLVMRQGSCPFSMLRKIFLHESISALRITDSQNAQMSYSSPLSPLILAEAAVASQIAQLSAGAVTGVFSFLIHVSWHAF